MKREGHTWRRGALLRAVLLVASAWLALPLRGQEPANPGTDGGPATQPAEPAEPPASSSHVPFAADGPNPSYGTATSTTPYAPGVQGLERMGRLPYNAFGGTSTGIPYSAVFAPTGADYGSVDPLTANPVQASVSDSPKLGNVEGHVSIGAGQLHLGVPFLDPSFSPDSAHLKAGPFYLRFNSLAGTMIYSDNFRLTENNRKHEFLVLLELNMTVVAQLSEGLQFALTGSILYLPIQNKVGVTSGLNTLGLLLSGGTLLASQFAYETDIGGWPVTFADDFRVGDATFSDGSRDNFSLFNGDQLEQDRETGRYTFRSNQGGLRDSNNGPNNNDNLFSYYSNTISALTDREIPGDIRLRARALHEDLWYNQDRRGLPESRDDFLISAVSERVNERFKPYASYEISRVVNVPGVYQFFRAGVFGPITDQLFLRAEGGYFISNTGHQDPLWRLSLQHDAGPYTEEFVDVGQDVSEFNQEEETFEYYRLQQVLGPTLNATLFAGHTNYKELENQGFSNHEQFIGGLRFLWDLGPKTTMSLAGIYQHENYSNSFSDTTLTGRLTLDRAITDSLSLQLLYQYQKRYGDRGGDNYYENLVFLRIVKYFE